MSGRRDSSGEGLTKQNIRLQRRVRQLERLVKTSEGIAERSKAAQQRALERQQDRAVELEAAKQVAEAALAAKDRFMATMSHEIRTPMNGVIGCIDLLALSQLQGEQKQLVETLGSSAETLMALLNDVLNFAKLEGGHAEAQRQPFSLKRVLTEIADLHRGAATARGTRLRLQIGDGAMGEVDGDDMHLRQVLGNLVGNAVKFTSGGKVTLRAWRCPGDERVSFEVIDTGIGIAPDALDNVFDAFTQAEGGIARRFGGTGLGLAISKTLVENMGGQLKVASTLGRGSKFSFVVPLARIPEVPTCADEDEPECLDAPAVPERPFRGTRILIVDDNPVNLVVATKMAERLGCEVTTASGGEDGARIALSGGFDAVFMDCSMPGVDGFEATRRIRTGLGESSRVPVIALTALTLDTDREQCFEGGMDDYLQKPLRLEGLRDAIARALERSERPPGGRMAG